MATTAPKAATTQPSLANASDNTKNGEQPTVNRKKQKRREKQAAKLAALQAQTPLASLANGTPYLSDETTSRANPHSLHEHINGGHASYSGVDDDLFYSEDELENDHATIPQSSSKSKRKKKKGRNEAANTQYDAFHVPGAFQPPPPPPPLLAPTSQLTHVAKPPRNSQKNSIWNTSTAEERERIKEFWVGLDELERRSLVKVEKEAVLKKMKEQQKHSCSCSVCGRKRNAIEEELEVLYDAYYEELETYANHRQLGINEGHPMLPPPRPYSSVSRMPLRQDSRNARSHMSPSSTMAGAFGNDDEEYTEDEEIDEGDEAEYDVNSFSSEPYHPAAADIFTLGRNLTAQGQSPEDIRDDWWLIPRAGGILTVADDLLKNDGRKFIEMMEQLAERRMQREEEAQYAARGLGHPSGHNHAPMDEDEYEDEEDEDYASDEEEDYDEEEMESMSEEQRMEEGRRMFQIFAARMFEQRVLTAYREKVARERQEKLLEELADESRLDEQREAKKARDAAKKKEKKSKQKAIKEEERLRREAEKAEQEAAAQAAEEKRLEEQRARKEAQRKKREAEKQAQEAERQKKEGEKLRKQQEAKELQAEQERRQRENKEKEKKRKEEAKRKEREEKEAREKERRDHEAAAKAELEAKELREREARDKSAKEEITKPIAQTVPVPIPLARKASSAVPLSSGVASALSGAPSPQVQIATPVLPKAQTTAKPRQPSRQGSIHSSPKSTTQPASSSATSPSTTNIPQPHAMPPTASKQIHTQQPIPQVPNMNPMNISMPPGIHHHPLNAMSMPPAMHNPPFAPGFGAGPPPGILPRGPTGHDVGGFPQQPFNSPMYRGFNGPPNSIGFPPGMGPAPRQNIPSRPIVDGNTTQTPIGTGVAIGSSQPASHSRNTSINNDQSTQIQPIGPPVATVRLPISTGRSDAAKHDIEGISQQLGSSALLGDGDDAPEPIQERLHHNTGAYRPARIGFGGSSAFPDAIGSAKSDVFQRSGWGAPPSAFGTPTMSHHPHWSPATTNQWPNTAFGAANTPRHSPAVALRLLICQACKVLSNHTQTGEPAGFGYHQIDQIMHLLEQNKPPTEPSPQLKEVLEICETEGNPQNGGGSLMTTEERGRGVCVKWIPDTMQTSRAPGGGPGEIGSPVVGSASPFGASRPFPGISSGGF